VDLVTGTLRSERIRVATPNPSTPDAVVASTARLVSRIARAVPDAARGSGTPVGVGIPSVVIDGETRSAANIDPGWIDYPAEITFHRALSRDVAIVNDADAAGIAEMRFGAGRGCMGTVLVLTLGTGVGSALFVDGVLVPNTELGHMEIRGRDAERRSAANARIRRGLSWKAWAADLDEHLIAINRLFSPNVFILGGGVSKNPDKFVPFLTVRVPVVPAQLRNDAGIVGAALFAAGRQGRPVVHDVDAVAGPADSEREPAENATEPSEPSEPAGDSAETAAGEAESSAESVEPDAEPAVAAGEQAETA
jgi:polyphosphate glucokinase